MLTGWREKIQSTFFGRSSSIRGGRLQEVLLVCHGDDPYGNAVAENVAITLTHGKIQFAVLDLANGGFPQELGRYDSVILCTERVDELKPALALEISHYVQSGGALVMAYRGWNRYLSTLLGVRTAIPEPDYRSEGTDGLHFREEIFPGTADEFIDDAEWRFEHCQLDLDTEDLTEDCSVLASDAHGRPILWYREAGRGRIIVWNTAILSCRALRGFFLQSLMAVMPRSVSAIAGIGLLQIDDFPPALSDAANAPVTEEYPGMDRSRFYFDVWLPDMLEIARRHALAFTCYTIVNYHDVDTRSPAKSNGLRDIALAGQIKERVQKFRDHAETLEFGFHGYNHVPMTADGWTDLSALEKKLRVSREIWEDHLPGKRAPLSFVPANNQYHAEHLQILMEIFPEIRVVCSLYSTGDPTMGEFRDFGPEPWRSNLLCLPRETCGYEPTPKQRMMQLSQIASLGIWTHFMHPDDIYDTPGEGVPSDQSRNPDRRLWRAVNQRGKSGLLTLFEDWIGETRRRYPWLEFMKTSGAIEHYNQFSAAQPLVFHTRDAISIQCDTSQLYYVRLGEDEKLQAARGAEILACDKVFSGRLYVLRCRAGRSVLKIA